MQEFLPRTTLCASTRPSSAGGPFFSFRPICKGFLLLFALFVKQLPTHSETSKTALDLVRQQQGMAQRLDQVEKKVFREGCGRSRGYVQQALVEEFFHGRHPANDLAAGQVDIAPSAALECIGDVGKPATGTGRPTLSAAPFASLMAPHDGVRPVEVRNLAEE
jgi:hypothetical protein